MEYGYYPQKAVNRQMQTILEGAFLSNALRKTGRGYTTDSVRYDEVNTIFQAKKHDEYEYRGKQYVRVQCNYGADEITLSNGQTYHDGENVWIEVEPVTWLVDERAKMMITEKIIFAGVQFNKKRNYHTRDFDKTDIKAFMDKYLSKELLAQRTIDEQTLNQSGEKRKKQDNNPYKFDFEDVSESDIIKSAIEGNVSIFLHGKPGCGKSDRVKQLDADFIELNLTHLDPELLDGLAGEKDGKAVHIKPPWLEELEEKCQLKPDKIHIVFLEELTNASDLMQAKAYGIALDKKVAGRWKLPEQARVIAAGNEIEDSKIANEIAEPLYDRFAHVVIQTSVESWLKWAVTPEESYEGLDYQKQKQTRPKIHPAIYSYITYKGDEVLRTPYHSTKPEPHADPRRWKMASDMLYASNKPWALKAIIGEDLTRDFISFCQIPTITVQDVIKGNYTPEDLAQMDLGRQLATVTSMLSVDSQNMPKIRKFVKEQLGEEMCAKFETQWAHGDEKKLEELQELKLMEKQEEEKRLQSGHTASESIFSKGKGILGFEQIEDMYQENLARQKKEHAIVDENWKGV